MVRAEAVPIANAYENEECDRVAAGSHGTRKTQDASYFLAMYKMVLCKAYPQLPQ